MGAENVIALTRPHRARQHRDSRRPAQRAEPSSSGRRAKRSRAGAALGNEPVAAFFRSESAELLPADDEPRPKRPDEIVVTGHVTQVSYPGGTWRHAVAVGGHEIQVDFESRHEPPARVQVRLPHRRSVHLPGCSRPRETDPAARIERPVHRAFAAKEGEEETMKRRLQLLSGAIVGALVSVGAPAMAETLTVMTAGDQNMVDYINDYLAPKFEAENPGVTVQAVGTGPGDAGSQMIYERLSAQASAGAANRTSTSPSSTRRWPARWSARTCSRPTASDIDTGNLVSRDTADDGARHQRARLRHADVPQPDGDRLQSGARAESAEDLRRAVAWVKEHPASSSATTASRAGCRA